MDAHVEQHLQALEFFKDWSNYLLVTTVAALGWAARSRPVPTWLFSVMLGCFALSIVAGIFTLALIPLIAEALTPSTQSFYDQEVSFFPLWIFPFELSGFRLKYVC
jgi:hypothetical protein